MQAFLFCPEIPKIGMDLDKYYQPYEDWIYEIGLTPNRMDAMSHWGVARDVCAYLNHHEKEPATRLPADDEFKIDNTSLDDGCKN